MMTVTGMSFVAQAAEVGSVIFRSLVLIGLIVAGAYSVLRLRRWLKEEDDAPAPPTGFTLDDLRELNRRGEMTDAEFERAKGQILAGARAAAGKRPHPLR